MKNELRTTEYYDLSKKLPENGKTESAWESLKGFYEYVRGDGWKLLVTLFLIILNSVATVATPYILSKAVDAYISKGNMSGLEQTIFILIGIYVSTFFFGYFQGVLMGQIAQSALFKMRNTIFSKLQALPLAFFNQNQSGDLISRINGDTQKLSQFLSESITRFAGSLFMLLGIGGFALYINLKMGLIMLAVVPILYIITKLLNPFAEKTNSAYLKILGGYSANIQEHISNFRVIIAYNKRKYFEQTLMQASDDVYKNGVRSGIINRSFEPIYDFGGYIALTAVTAIGIWFVFHGQITVGALIAYIAYTQRFYDPLRTFATIIGAIQVSIAAWGRIRSVLSLDNGLPIIELSAGQTVKTNSTQNISAESVPRLELRNMTFGYTADNPVLEDVSLEFYPAKTYALVGPTGGGKSTLANIMSRLYDPWEGEVFFDGRDIRSYSPSERAQKISVILQEPLLFSGTVAENIKYGNTEIINKNDAELEALLKGKGFTDVLARFENGLTTEVKEQSGSGLSLGQKQLISFMRAVLREPELLILDEATANIDTVTEAILNKTLASLPQDTTKVIIAHRLNTIEEADEIMFVNGHHVTKAGGLDEAIRLIENSKRKS